MSLWTRFLAWVKYLRNAYVANDAWFGTDKVIHGLAGAWVWLLGRVLLGPAFLQRAVLAVLFAVGFEIWQLVRYLHWWNHGAQGQRPAQSDLFSYKDVLWGLLGAFTVVLMFLRFHVSP